MCAFDSNSVEASLSFVEAARGRDEVDEHQRQNRALSYPDAFVPSSAIASETFDFVHIVYVCINAGGARERKGDCLPPLELVYDWLFYFLSIRYEICVLRQAIESFLDP